MKSLASLICETQDALIASGKFTAEKLKESVKDCLSDEHRLSVLKSLAKKHNIKESVTITETRPRITRNNGASYQGPSESTRSDIATEAAQLSRSYGISISESTVLLTPPVSVDKQTETDNIKLFARRYGCSIREATMHLTGKDPANTDEAKKRIKSFMRSPYNMSEAEATRAATEGFDF